MGSDATPQPRAYVGQLTDHARQLQRQARSAIAAGDYARAAQLIGDAELLASDVHDLVDDLEQRDIRLLLRLAARYHAEAGTGGRVRRPILPLPPRSIRAALGTSIVMSLALVEC